MNSCISTISYLQPSAAKPYQYIGQPPAGLPSDNCHYIQRQVWIDDARPTRPSLAVQGFELHHAPVIGVDFHDKTQIKSAYYPALQALALQATGGREAIVFDHLVRQREAGRPALGFGRQTRTAVAGAVGRAHNDYTEQSGAYRLELELGQDATRWSGHYCIINIWRPIGATVVDAPLALCDSRSVQPGDLIACDIRYPNRVGEIYLLGANPAHRWSYFHGLTPDEAIVFKQYDTRRDGVSRITPHAAFEHPQTPADAPLRQSIEARILVLL